MQKERASFKGFFRNYQSLILLLTGVFTGSILGLIFKEQIEFIKPIGDIFLNLLLTAIIPLIFFAIASAIANIDSSHKLSKVMRVMSIVFLSTILVSAFLTIVATWVFPIHDVESQAAPVAEAVESGNLGQQLTDLVSVGDFYQILSRKSMLAFIIFSVLVGFATIGAGKDGEIFRNFLNSGNEVMKSLLSLIMKLAPVGLGAYFGYQVGVFGPQLFGTYARSLGLYYGFGFFYFIVLFSVYAFVAGGLKAVHLYWRNNILPSATAIGTCSSIATIPANLLASSKMKIPESISNVVIPLGASLHKDGSSIASVIKIGVAFAMLNKQITGVDVICLALGISVLVSIVEGGIPSGGYIGEFMMISAYGFPVEVLPAIMIIGTLVDPLATLLNASGDTVAGMLITRFTRGKNWMNE